MDVSAKLGSWGKKTISKEELAGLFNTAGDAELYNLVQDAVDKGALVPVKGSGTDGNRVYPLYLKYKITIKEDYTTSLSEIAMLHPALNKSGYLGSKPKEYLNYRAQLERLSAYLYKNQPKIPVSKKERAFEIFGEEKQLEDRTFCGLLDRLGLTPEVLNYYETPEYCFNDYIPERKDNMVLLILENKDIWFNIRRRMYEDGARQLLGVHIDGVVYGSGNRVSKQGALLEYTKFMGAKATCYLYWGDIDRAGLNIFLSLQKSNPQMNIKLFLPAYEEMLRRAEHTVLPDSEDHRELMGDYEDIYSLFSNERKTQLKRLIEDNKRLPQEIINYASLRMIMR